MSGELSAIERLAIAEEARRETYRDICMLQDSLAAETDFAAIEKLEYQLDQLNKACAMFVQDIELYDPDAKAEHATEAQAVVRRNRPLVRLPSRVFEGPELRREGLRLRAASHLRPRVATALLRGSEVPMATWQLAINASSPNIPPDLRARALGEAYRWSQFELHDGKAENLVTEVYRTRTLSQIKLLPLLGEGSAPTTRFRRALMRLAAVWLMNVGVSRVVNDTPIISRGRVNMQGLASMCGGLCTAGWPRREPPAHTPNWHYGMEIRMFESEAWVYGCSREDAARGSFISGCQHLYLTNQPVKVVGGTHMGLLGSVKSVLELNGKVTVTVVPSDPTERAPSADMHTPGALSFGVAFGRVQPVLPLLAAPSPIAVTRVLTAAGISRGQDPPPGAEGRPITLDAQAVGLRGGLTTDGLAVLCAEFPECGENGNVRGGRGLRYVGQAPIARGRLIGAFVGKGLRTRSSHEDMMSENALAGTHAMPLRGWVVDAAGSEVGVALINEGAAPNVEFKLVDVAHEGTAYSLAICVARKRILSGDTLHADYGSDRSYGYSGTDRVREAASYSRPCADMDGDGYRPTKLKGTVESYFVNGNNDEALRRVLRWGGVRWGRVPPSYYPVQHYGPDLPDENVARPIRFPPRP